MFYLRLYNIVLFVAAFFLVPYYGLKIVLTGKYKASIGQKFGVIPRGDVEGMKGSPRIWVHAVSVGEVTAAAPIVSSLRELFPHACIVLSTGTETGQMMARRMVASATSFIYFPLDLPFVVRKVVTMVRPDIFIPVETELWPNFIRICSEKGVRIVMVNGRISPRSFARYAKTDFLWKRVLSLVDRVGMISRTDADRIGNLGMQRDRIHIMGNAKYDGLAARATDTTLKDEIGKRLNVEPGSQVFVAGSTHGGEERIVFAVYRKLLAHYPDLLLILVPRHIERREDILSLAEEEGFTDLITMTEINGGKKRTGERVIVIDVIGELFKVYSLATVVFCGGSLVPRGGQNILEPAAWGNVVLYGPSMEDFTDEKKLLEETGAGITVRDEDELFQEVSALLEQPAGLSRRGDAGKEAVVANMGASRRYAHLVQEVLGGQ